MITFRRQIVLSYIICIYKTCLHVNCNAKDKCEDIMSDLSTCRLSIYNEYAHEYCMFIMI